MASPLVDIPDALAATLGCSSSTAELLLCAAILVALSMMLAIAKMKMLGISIANIGAMATLTAVGWLPVWVMVLCILLISSQFAGAAYKTISGG